MQSSDFRSATHATHSTFKGCTANNAATIALRFAKRVSLPQNPEQQHHVQGVQKDIHGMRTLRAHTEHLHVRHVRNPGQWMPVGLNGGRDRPHDIARRKPLQNMRIRSNVCRIVVIQKLIVERRQVQNYGRGEKDACEKNNHARIALMRSPYSLFVVVCFFIPSAWLHPFAD